MSKKNEDDGVYALVSQIDKELRTPDLRNYFAKLIESEAFLCFHYRHRPHSGGQFNICICKIKVKLKTYFKIKHELDLFFFNRKQGLMISINFIIIRIG